MVFEGSLRAYKPTILDLRRTVGNYLETIYNATMHLREEYESLPPEERYKLEKTALIVATYLASTVSGHPELGIVLHPAIEQLYDSIKTRNIRNLGKVARNLYDGLKQTKPKRTELTAQAIASIIGLSILGLGFSLRLGTEVTGKVGSVNWISLPLILIFFSILLISVFYILRKKS